MIDVSTSSLATLRSVFGYEQFHGEHSTIIDHPIGGDALMPTGRGKSLT